MAEKDRNLMDGMKASEVVHLKIWKLQFSWQDDKYLPALESVLYPCHLGQHDLTGEVLTYVMVNFIYQNI